MADYIMSVQNLRKSYLGGKEVIKDLTLSFLPNAKIGVIGTNGSGKSTLMKILCGMDKDFSGELYIRPNIKVGYLSQEPVLDNNLSVKDNILKALEPLQNLLKEFNEISLKFTEDISEDEMNELLEKQADLQTEIENKNAWDLDRQVEVAMEALRCPDEDRDVKTLSGGERRRIALCKLLLEKPDILLLDEPTNHLDAGSVAWLERYLKEYQGMLILVTHDRYFLDNVTDWILELDRGEGHPYKGNYSDWLDQKYKRIAAEDKQKSTLAKTLDNELSWIRENQKGRHSKSKARISAYENLLSKEHQEAIYNSQIIIPPGERLGENVIKADKISKSFDNRVLIENLSFNIPKGAIVGIVGANGAGKSTLFKMIEGKEKPDSGSLTIGETVSLGFVDQSRDSLNDKNNIWQEISEGLDEIELGARKVQSRAYVAQFAFKGTDQQKLIGVLSGGERNRVHLAKVLKKPHNVILLDEPSNDLDIETLRALETAVLNFAGCVLVISHDRWFLNRIATHIIAFEDSNNIVFFEGNYSEYEEDLKKRLGVENYDPRRIKYKPISISK